MSLFATRRLNLLPSVAVRGVGEGLAVLAACCGLSILGDGAAAQDVRVLAQVADWELVRVADVFADRAVQCQVRTRTRMSAGRRERPLIIFELSSNQVVVRPDFALQGSVTANRALQGGTGDWGGRHPVMIRHGIRIDGGTLHSIDVKDDGSSTLEAHFDEQVYAALAREAQNGKMLYYLWSVASSRKSFEFPLDGLRQLLPTARQDCMKLSGS